jgi:hypothetical protein
MKTHNEVRFHLQAGVNYKKWQVKVVRDGRKAEVYYLDPAQHRLELRGCRLANNLNKAKKVHAAGVKDVSGWIECDEVLTSDLPVDGLERLFYNPIKDVRWRREGDEGQYEWDDTEYATLVTEGRQVYILEEREACHED